MNVGSVIQVIGPVLDIKFENGNLPDLLNAIEIEKDDKKIVCEVAQHLGDDVVRCIAMSSTDGLTRGAKAIDTKKGITVPVGAELRILSSVKPVSQAIAVEPTLEDVFLYYFGERSDDQ